MQPVILIEIKSTNLSNLLEKSQEFQKTVKKKQNFDFPRAKLFCVK